MQMLLTQMESDSHAFEDVDLPLMSIVQRHTTWLLPFKTLLEDVNRVHRRGFDETE